MPNAPDEFIYRTTYLHEADMVANALEDARIAFVQQAETPGGVRFAMPLAASVGSLPGSAFLVVVRGEHAARARKIVSALPISRTS